MLFYMLIMAFIKHLCNKKMNKEINLKTKNSFLLFKTKNRLLIKKVHLNYSLKFQILRMKTKFKATFQIVNNKGLRRQKWEQNNHKRIVFILHLWMQDLLLDLHLISLRKIINGLIRQPHRSKLIKIVNLIICPKRLQL